MDKYLLIQTAIGDYRQSVLDMMRSRLSDAFVILTGRVYFNKTTKTAVSLERGLEFIDNRFLLGRRLLWQSRVVFRAVVARSVILEFNPRILSNWVILVLRRLFGRKTAMWGHAWARAGSRAKTAVLRRTFRALCDSLVVYTERQRQEVLEEGKYRGKVIAAPNALYSARDMKPVSSGGAQRLAFIYVGRLVQDKHPDRLLTAFVHVFEKISGASLIIVGDGPMRPELESIAARLPPGVVRFAGHVSDVRELYSLYCQSIASVSPGYVGLSITQSLGFGVPMIISRDEDHAPEIEAAQEGFNSVFFDRASVDHLAECLCGVWGDKDMWISKADQISGRCAREYSTEVMAERLIAAFQSLEQS